MALISGKRDQDRFSLTHNAEGRPDISIPCSVSGASSAEYAADARVRTEQRNCAPVFFTGKHTVCSVRG